MLGRAPGDRLVGRGLEGLLLGGRHALPGFQVDAEQVVSDEVRGQHDLRHHLVELHVLHVGQRVVLAVDRSGLQPRINLGVSHGRGIRANRAAKELPRIAGRHPELDAGHVGRGVDFLLGFQADLPRAEERRPEDFHLDLVLDHLLHLRAEITGKEGIQMVGVAEQVRRSQDRPCRDLLGNILRRDIAHLQVVALQGDQLRALLEQGPVVEGLHFEIALDLFREHLDHPRADVLVGEHRCEADGGLGLRSGRQHVGSSKSGACLERRTTIDLEIHVNLLL